MENCVFEDVPSGIGMWQSSNSHVVSNLFARVESRSIYFNALDGGIISGNEIVDTNLALHRQRDLC